MLKLSYFVRSRSAVSEKVAGKVSNTSNALWTHCFTTQAGTRSNQIFADYTVFKGKAALSVYPLLPKFNESETSSKYDKKGCILLKFWPAIGERKYDWQKRQMIALSPTEVGSLISLEPGKSCEFFHDPSMKSSNAGQVRKSLSVTPLGEDGYMFNLNVVNNILKINERFAVPVTKAEYTVMRTAFSFILPHIMGWNQITQQVSASSDLNPVRQQEMRLSPALEWNR